MPIHQLQFVPASKLYMHYLQSCALFLCLSRTNLVYVEVEYEKPGCFYFSLCHAILDCSFLVLY